MEIKEQMQWFNGDVFIVTHFISGITGHVRIDSVGDRDADYAILDLDPVTGKFEVGYSFVLNFYFYPTVPIRVPFSLFF